MVISFSFESCFEKGSYLVLRVVLKVVMNEQLRLYLSEVFPGISYPYEGKTVLTIEKQVVYPWDVEGSS